MHDEFFDAEATRKVAERALLSSLFAFLGGSAAIFIPLSSYVIIPAEIVAFIVAISAIRTLNHPEAQIIGGIRHGGIVLAALGAVAAVIGVAFRVLVLVSARGL